MSANTYNAQPYTVENAPKSEIGSYLAKASEAQFAAAALTKLLRNDALVSSMWVDGVIEAAKTKGAPKDVEETEPLDDFMRGGLFAALTIALDQIGQCVIELEEIETRRVNALTPAKTRKGGAA